MVRQCIDYEDTHEILTEWNKWDNLVQEGYGTLVDQNFEKMIPLWWKTWEIFQKIVKTAEYKIGISGLMESQDYEYPIGQYGRSQYGLRIFHPLPLPVQDLHNFQSYNFQGCSF